jgi:hypothetical protein
MADLIPEEDMTELRGMLSELLALESGLSNWEIEFLDSLNEWTGCFTEKQAEKLSTIYKHAVR